MTPFEEIERDLSWREAELAMLRILLSNNSITEREKLVLFRAAWALLYAHYEGFCKFSLTVYFDALKNSGAKCGDFSPKTQAFALTDKLKEVRNLPPVDLLSTMVGFAANDLQQTVEFPDVDTESNLWPRTLARLLEDADLEVETLPLHNRAIATLVNRRNKIAHGEREIIPEFNYYISFEDAVKTIMYDLALAIDGKLSSN